TRPCRNERQRPAWLRQVVGRGEPGCVTDVTRRPGKPRGEWVLRNRMLALTLLLSLPGQRVAHCSKAFSVGMCRVHPRRHAGDGRLRQSVPAPGSGFLHSGCGSANFLGTFDGAVCWTGCGHAEREARGLRPRLAPEIGRASCRE